MKVSELIEQLRAFESNADVIVQLDRGMSAPTAWIGFMDTAGLFGEEESFQLVISAWEPDEYLRKPTK